MKQKRQAPRPRILQRAQIVFAGGFSKIDCVVMDISENGARLKKGEWLSVPEHFELRIVGGRTYSAELRYYDGTFVGVRFIPPSH